MKPFKSLTLAALAALSAIQVGCTDREVASGIGGAALGALLVGVHTAQPSPPPRRRTHTCDTSVERRTYGYRDYNGNWVETTEVSRDTTCSRGYRMMEFGGTPAASVDPVAVGSTYKMSADSAQLMLSALAQAQTAADDQSAAAALGQLGIERADAEKLAQFQLPDAQGIDRIAHALNQSPEATSSMLTAIMAEAAAQQAARQGGEKSSL